MTNSVRLRGIEYRCEKSILSEDLFARLAYPVTAYDSDGGSILELTVTVTARG